MIANYPQKYLLTHQKRFIYKEVYFSHQIKNRAAGETKLRSMKITYFSDK